MRRIGVLEASRRCVGCFARAPIYQTHDSGSTMQTFSRNAALLIVDVQQGFDEPAWGRRNNPLMETRIVELLRAWRGTRRAVIHARHMSADPVSPLRPGQPGNDFKAEVAPLPGEFVVEKRVNSCFIGTPLERELRRRGHDTLVIVGMMTNHCVSTTARMAGNLGFAVWIVSDATATFDRVGPTGVNHRAEQIHAIALSDLHGEFGLVVDTATVLAAIGTPIDAFDLREERA
jgi:nicotinamidase-related amidase